MRTQYHLRLPGMVSAGGRIRHSLPARLVVRIPVFSVRGDEDKNLLARVCVSW